jgi:hypothetical protein
VLRERSVDGSNNHFSPTSSVRLRDGISVIGDNNTFTGNRSQLNAGAGFAVVTGTGSLPA